MERTNKIEKQTCSRLTEIAVKKEKNQGQLKKINNTKEKKK